jgi:hypothetical protein
MPTGRKFEPTPEQVEMMTRAYVVDELSSYEIVRRLKAQGVITSPETVRAYLVRTGIAMRKGGDAQRENRRPAP